MAALLKPVKVIIRGPHDSGRTTLASLLKNFFEEAGYAHVMFKDTVPLPHDQKPSFPERFDRNRERRPIEVIVELEE